MPLDIGVGILLALGVSAGFAIPLTPFLVFLGVAAALLPDIDIVTRLFGRWRHRELTHYPLLYVPLVALAFLLASLPYAILFSLGVLAHFIHDTIGIGWGIAWLWPFSGCKLLVLPERARRQELGRIVTWLPEEEPALRSRHYEGASTDWVRDFYFRPNPLAYIEYGVLLLSFVAFAFYIW